jgi:hypothetical protein
MRAPIQKSIAETAPLITEAAPHVQQPDKKRSAGKPL